MSRSALADCCWACAGLMFLTQKLASMHYSIVALQSSQSASVTAPQPHARHGAASPR